MGNNHVDNAMRLAHGVLSQASRHFATGGDIDPAGAPAAPVRARARAPAAPDIPADPGVATHATPYLSTPEIKGARYETPAAHAQAVMTEHHGTGLQFPHEESMFRLSSRLRRRQGNRPNMGEPANPRTVIKAPAGSGLPDYVAGKLTHQDWIDRHENILQPEEVHQAAAWYHNIYDEFLRYYPDPEEAKRNMRAWLVAQQNVSPAGAMNNVLLQKEQAARGVPEELWRSGGMPAPTAAARAVLAGRDLEGGVGQKIADFVDSAENKPVRSWMANHPDGGKPFVVDVHTGRDTGLVDPELKNHLIRKGYDPKEVNKLVVDMKGTPTEANYENRGDFGRSLTDELNKRGWMGRKDWTPSEVQAVGWMGMTKLLRGQQEDSESGLGRNFRRTSFEVAPGKGSRWDAKFGPAFAALQPHEQAAITQEVGDRALEHASRLAGVDIHSLVHGTGMWQHFQNPAAVAQALSTQEGADIGANALGYLLDQDEVWHNRVKPMTANPKAFGVDFMERGSKRLADPEFLKQVWAKVREADPYGLFEGFHPLTTPEGDVGFRALISKGGKGTQQKLEQLLADGSDPSQTQKGAVARALEAFGPEFSVHGHEAEITKHRNDWKEHPNGEGYLARLVQALGQNPQPALDNARRELEQIFTRHLDEKHGGKGVDWRKAYGSSSPPSTPLRRGGSVVDRALRLTARPAKAFADGGAPERQLSPSGFYSGAAEAARNLPQQKGTMQQFGSMLGKAGAKPAELQNSGLDFSSSAPMDRATLASHLQGRMPQLKETQLTSEGLNGGNTRYDQYTIPGGRKYRELLLHASENPIPPASDEEVRAAAAESSRRFGRGFENESPEEQASLLALARDRLSHKHRRNPTNYQSSHWDAPNVLAHLRMSERELPKEKKFDPSLGAWMEKSGKRGTMLHLEELQSDWGQDARKHGLNDLESVPKHKEALAAIKAKYGVTDADELPPEGQKEWNEAYSAFDQAKNGVPRHPYIANTNAWADLGLKRALIEAARGGHERLAWTPGQEQADRYGLEKRFRQLMYEPDTKMLYAFGNQNVTRQLKPEELPDAVGPGIAQRLLATTPNGAGQHVLHGMDLREGGEGMKSFYDKMVPARLTEILKKLGHKAEFAPVKIQDYGDPEDDTEDYEHTLHSLKLPPELREKILKGLPAFERGGEVDPPEGYADGGAVDPGMPEPKNTVKAYKLFRHKNGKLYPLYVNADQEVPIGKWLKAEAGPQGKDKGKVKSKLGDLAYRPGWHSGDMPVATHIGAKSRKSLKAPDTRPPEHVWAEVEHPADVDWQSVANSRAEITKAGTPNLRTAHITDQVPHGGFYRYKTNSNMTGNWLISGGMKVNRVLPDEEVAAINQQHGVYDLPRREPSNFQPQDDLVDRALRATAKPAKMLAEGGPIETGDNPYETRQDGPFWRVRKKASGGNRPGTEGAGGLGGLGAPVGGGSGQVGDGNPQSSAEGRLAQLQQIADEHAARYGRGPVEDAGVSESSLHKQSAIGRAFQLAATDHPEYKKAVFDAYIRHHPELVRQAGARDYDSLRAAAYHQLGREVKQQFDALPLDMSFHRHGEGDYESSKHMRSDVLDRGHLAVFQGGDRHDFLHNADPHTGLNENEMFRAIHDAYGHALHGSGFGAKGEERAWNAHRQMFSPLAALAMSAETRGQNSFVNYTPINAQLTARKHRVEAIMARAKKFKNDEVLQRAQELKKKVMSGWKYAPQKAVLLPPEMNDPAYAGGMPDYIQKLIKPEPGTGISSPITHFSPSPDVKELDPGRYGTGIPGDERARVLKRPGGVKERAYGYLGTPEQVTPEPGLGSHAYVGQANDLYDMTKDPMKFGMLAREANRNNPLGNFNPGNVNQAQAMNDMERMAKEHGYSGVANPKAAFPMAALFQKTPVSAINSETPPGEGLLPRANGGAISSALRIARNLRDRGIGRHGHS